ncbi:MAG: aminotransferase class III, partial [Thalassobius sp.]|nr:aminotransferase class III [Thalassovita sp.]
KPIKMVSAAFQYMFDADGNTYLDAYNNIPLVGHSHPRITEAAQQQIALLNTNTRYLYDNLHEYAERLLAKFPAKLNKIFFVNSGSAASDLAMRLARAYSNKKEIAVMEYGYHGNTQQCIDISSYKADGKGGKGLNDYVYKLPLPDAYKGEHTGKDAGILYAQEAINLLNSKPTLPGAFIAEPIIGCGGQIPLPDGYLQKLYEFLQAQNILCISDEVQVGMGRLGSTFWGFEQHGVIPDIVIIGKPIGNGHPMAAVVCTEEVAQAFENGMEFFSSFGGNPVSCSIGNAVLDVLEEENLQQHAKITGEHLIQGFKTLAKNYAQIGDVRGSGLFLGIEIVDQNGNRSELAGEQAAIIKNKLRDKFILSSTDGPYESVLKFKPPLCFNTKNADQLLNAVEQILKTM